MHTSVEVEPPPGQQVAPAQNLGTSVKEEPSANEQEELAQLSEAFGLAKSSDSQLEDPAQPSENQEGMIFPSAQHHSQQQHLDLPKMIPKHPDLQVTVTLQPNAQEGCPVNREAIAQTAIPVNLSLRTQLCFQQLLKRLSL